MRATSLNSHTKLPFMWVWGLSQGLGIRIKSSCGRNFKFTSGAPALPADRLFEWSFIQSYYVMIPRDMNRILLRYYHLYGLSHYHHTFWWRLQNCSKMTSRKQLFLEVSIGNSSFMSKLFLFSTFCEVLLWHFPIFSRNVISCVTLWNEIHIKCNKISLWKKTHFKCNCISCSS